MKHLLFFIALTSAIAYFAYVLFWRTRSVAKSIKGDLDKSINFLGKSTDWISWILLGTAVMAAIVYKYL